MRLYLRFGGESRQPPTQEKEAWVGRASVSEQQLKATHRELEIHEIQALGRRDGQRKPKEGEQRALGGAKRDQNDERRPARRKF